LDPLSMPMLVRAISKSGAALTDGTTRSSMVSTSGRNVLPRLRGLFALDDKILSQRWRMGEVMGAYLHRSLTHGT